MIQIIKRSVIGAMVLVLLFFSVGCRDTDIGKRTHSPISVSRGNVSKVFTYMCQTDTGKKISVRSEAVSSSLVKVVVATDGFDRDETYDMGELDPIDTLFLADLDKDGFQEFYMVTESVGSGSYHQLYGIASNKDRSTSPIFVVEKEGGLFKGFMGHNVFSVGNGILTETFPVYMEGDSNALPTGGERKIYYTLSREEAGWVLKIKELSN